MNAKSRPNSALFTLAALVSAIAALHFAREILLPLSLAVLLSFLLSPLAERLERWHLGRIPSVLAVVSIAFVALGLLGWVVTSQLIDLSSNLGQYRENIVAKVKTVTQGSAIFKGVTDTVEDVQAAIGEDKDQEARDEEDADQSRKGANQANEADESSSAGEPAERQDELTGIMARIFSASNGLSKNTEDAVEVKVVSMPPSPLAQVQGWLGPLMAPLTGAGMVIVLVLFMLLQREDQRNRLIRLFGTNNIHATTEALTDIVNRVSRYLRMQFLINAGYGLCVGAGLALIGLPNAVMFGVLSFSLRFLPYIGPWISAVLPVAVAFAVTEGWTTAIMVVALFVVLELLVNNVAEPLLYGSSIGVSGVGIIIAAIFWTWLWGAIGLVLAMPLTVCLVVMARYVPALRFITVMLGDQPTLTPEERIYQRMLALDDDEVRDLADEELETATTGEFYDRTLIPALRLAEYDREGGILSDEQQATIQEVARELLVELAARDAADNEKKGNEGEPTSLPEAPRARVLCIPLRDESDKTAGLMLAQLLEDAEVETVMTSPTSLTSERVAKVAEVKADLVVVSVLPPLPQRDSRLLCRRLRKQYPSLPIVVGYWEGGGVRDSYQLLAAKGDGDVVTTLAEAVARVRAVASRTPAGDEPSRGEAALPGLVSIA